MKCTGVLLLISLPSLSNTGRGFNGIIRRPNDLIESERWPDHRGQGSVEVGAEEGSPVGDGRLVSHAARQTQGLRPAAVTSVAYLAGLSANLTSTRSRRNVAKRVSALAICFSDETGETACGAALLLHPRLSLSGQKIDSLFAPRLANLHE